MTWASPQRIQEMRQQGQGVGPRNPMQGRPGGIFGGLGRAMGGVFGGGGNRPQMGGQKPGMDGGFGRPQMQPQQGPPMGSAPGGYSQPRFEQQQGMPIRFGGGMQIGQNGQAGSSGQPWDQGVNRGFNPGGMGQRMPWGQQGQQIGTPEQPAQSREQSIQGFQDMFNRMGQGGWGQMQVQPQQGGGFDQRMGGIGPSQGMMGMRNMYGQM